MRLIEILTERKQVGTVYHFTSSGKLFNILDLDILKAFKTTQNFRNNLAPKNFELTVSTTRDKNFVKTRSSANKQNQIGGTDFALVLDGNLLSDKYQTMSYDDTYSPREDEFERARIKKLYGDEMEQLWYGKRIESDRGIKNIKRYTIKIIMTQSFMKRIVTGDYRWTDFTREFKSKYIDSWNYETSPMEKLKQIKNFIETEYNIPVEIQK